jgi:hypothetical protein
MGVDNRDTDGVTDVEGVIEGVGIAGNFEIDTDSNNGDFDTDVVLLNNVVVPVFASGVVKNGIVLDIISMILIHRHSLFPELEIVWKRQCCDVLNCVLLMLYYV